MMNATSSKLVFYFAILTALLTLITFGIAINTPPISGVFCLEDCIEYPYLNIQDRFPRDYLWMFPAILLNFSFLIMIVAVHHSFVTDRKVLSHISVIFALMSALVLNADYFLQLSVIQPAVLRGEKDGISMLTQYNPHGIFIALEELGYLLMGIALLFIGLAFTKTQKFGLAVRWISIISFALALVSLIWIRATHGFDTGYLYEVVVISIEWLTLLAISVLMIFSLPKS